MSNEMNQPLDRLVRYDELEKLFGRCKKSIKRHSAVGRLPRLIRDGKIVGMLASDVEAHFQRLGKQTAR
jgi:predicted DNA-binding transcriptional regulator AlpA